MTTCIPSVIDTYFQHKLLTKVLGQPTYESLQNLSTKIKAIVSTIPSTIGGGLIYGHLGLILSDLRYATLADTVPWVTTSNPAPFMPPAGATGPPRMSGASSNSRSRSAKLLKSSNRSDR